MELTWIHKDECLLADEVGAYQWGPPSDLRVAEVRFLDNDLVTGRPNELSSQIEVLRTDQDRPGSKG